MTRFNINSYIISRNRSCRNTLATQFQDELDKAMYQQMAGDGKNPPFTSAINKCRDFD
jgi:hypothetical protein